MSFLGYEMLPGLGSTAAGTGSAFDPVNLNNLAYYGNPSSTGGALTDGARSFTAANKEYLEGGDYFSLETGHFTFGAWVYITGTSGLDMSILAQWDSGQAAAALYYDQSEQDFTFSVSSDGSSVSLATSTLNVSQNKWYCLIGRHDDGTNITLRVRAEDAGSWTEYTPGVAHTGGVHNSTAKFYAGTFLATTRYSSLNLDSCFVIKNLTTDAEDDAFYASGAGVTYADLEDATSGALSTLHDKFSTTGAFWDMDAAGGEIEIDRTGNGNNLTATADELLTDNDFTGDGSDWNAAGTRTWTIDTANDEADATADAGGNDDLQHATPITPTSVGLGVGDIVAYSITSGTVSAGSSQIIFGGNAGNTVSSSDQTVTGNITVAGASNTFRLRNAAGNFTGSIVNVSIKKASPCPRVAGVTAGAATDVNRATAFDGVDQYFNLPAKNKFAADDSIAYASTGSLWVSAFATLDSNPADIGALGLPTAGLPVTGIATAFKLTDTAAGSVTLAQTSADSITLPNTNKQMFSLYVIAGGTWSGGVVSLDAHDFTGSSESDTVTVTPNATTWQRISEGVTGAADLVGRIRIQRANAGTAGEVLYFTAVQWVEEDTLSAWDANALFSPGDQDFWVSAWIRPDDTTNGAMFSRLGAVGYYEYNLMFNANDVRFYVSELGTDFTIQVEGLTSPAVPQWYHVFCYHQSGTGIGIIVDAGTPVTAAHTGGVHQAADAACDWEIGSRAGGSLDYAGRLDAVMMGTAAHGWTDLVTNTPASIASALYNGGRGLKAKALTAAQKSAWGLVDAWDMDDDQGDGSLTSTENSIALTGNGTPAPTVGDSEGVNYIPGSVARLADFSGGANHFDQTDPTIRPEFVSNVWGTNPGIRFNGTDQLLEAITNNFLTGNVGAVFALVQIDTALNARMVLLSQADDGATDDYTDVVVRGDNTDPNIVVSNNNNGAGLVEKQGNTTINAGTDYIMMWESDGSAHVLRVNNAGETEANLTGTPAGEWFNDLGTADSVALGAAPLSTVARYYSGYIGPVIVIDGGSPSAADISNCEDFLNTYAGGGVF